MPGERSRADAERQSSEAAEVAFVAAELTPGALGLLAAVVGGAIALVARLRRR